MAKHIESKIQQECVKWFRLQYPRYDQLLFAVPNGGGRSKIEACIMKGEGTLAGVSDLILLLPNNQYHALCIEMKHYNISWDTKGKEHKEKTYQSPAQKAWQSAVELQGYKYVVCRDVEEFIKEIQDYIGS